MSAITPDSYVKLVRFDVTKEHQMTFASLTAQTDFFTNLQGLELQASTYQRKEGKVRFPVIIDDIENYNYLMYKNESNSNPNYYSDKIYYCYIKNMEYINDNMTEITIEIDVFQTWQFDFVYKKCFVEREHVNDDTVGKNIVPEGLEHGDYISNDVSTMDSLNKTVYLVQVTKDYYDQTHPIIYGTEISGLIFTGAFYICFSYGDLMSMIQDYTTDADLGFDCILNVYLVPYRLTANYVGTPNPPATGIIRLLDSTTVNLITKSMTKPTSIDGYTPTNKKLLTKDYNYLLVSNNNGTTGIFYYENFTSSRCVFNIYGMVSFGCDIALVPSNYGASGLFYNNFKIAGGKFPPSDYIKDNFQIWLRANSVNLQLGVAGGLVETGVGAVRTIAGDINGVVNIGSGIGQILGIMKETYIQSKVPPTSAGNTNIATLNVAQNSNSFSFTQMCIKSTYAKILDDFFSMYGYKVTEIKIPNITGRQNWNYVKTNNAIVESSSVPEIYLDEFKEMLNNGMTFWHNPQTFLDYSQSNPIV